MKYLVDVVCSVARRLCRKNQYSVFEKIFFQRRCTDFFCIICEPLNIPYRPILIETIFKNENKSSALKVIIIINCSEFSKQDINYCALNKNIVEGREAPKIKHFWMKLLLLFRKDRLNCMTKTISDGTSINLFYISDTVA